VVRQPAVNIDINDDPLPAGFLFIANNHRRLRGQRSRARSNIMAGSRRVGTDSWTTFTVDPAAPAPAVASPNTATRSRRRATEDPDSCQQQQFAGDYGS
jgi:hypothetical protein